MGRAACVPPALVRTVDQPGINLSALRSDPDAVRRLGVRVTVSQSCMVDPPTPVSRLLKACGDGACVVYRRPVCSADQASCTYAFAVPPSGTTRAVRLETVTFDAASAARRAEVEEEVLAVGASQDGVVRIPFARLTSKVYP